MKCFISLITIAIASAKVSNTNDCGVIVHGKAHQKQCLLNLKKNVDKPYQLAIDYDTNLLYFSYTAKGGNVFDLASLDLKYHSHFNLVTGVEEPFANAVDDKTRTVYFGGNDGIYKLNGGSHNATNLNITQKNIWQLFYKNGLYFTTYPNEEAYVYSGGEVHKVIEIGDTRAILIGVDNRHNIIYANISGLFYYKKEDKQTIYIGDYVVNSITNDIKGNIFFSTPTGIYSIDENTMKVNKLAVIDNVFGVAIEKDGSIIYASDNNLIRLKSTGKDCFD